MTIHEFIEKYSLMLDAQQLEAVCTGSEPTLLLAVPGSGKTTALTARIGYLVFCEGIRPENILAVTYTRAAAADMRSRFSAVFGSETGERIEFCTINGLCSRILFRYSNTIKQNPFTLLSEERVIKKLLSDIYLSFNKGFPADSDISELARLISYSKNMMLDKEQRSELDSEHPHFSEMYAAYDGYMRENMKMDYDDQMRFSRIIMGRYPEILEYFRNKYRCICVDEAQDTSKLQHAIINLLRTDKTRFFMVGDEDQSIYGFRAAFPDALTGFEKANQGARVLLLENNYRSNALIVKAADKFIKGNILRHSKTMNPVRPEGEPVRVIPVKSRAEQYDILLEAARSPCGSTAVLYRDNECALPLIDLLERSGAAYNVKARELSFFSSRTVRDLRDFALLSDNPYDYEAFMRLYYKLKLYISRNEAKNACAISVQTGTDVFQALILAAGDDARKAGKYKELAQNMRLLGSDSGLQAILRISSDLNYSDYLSDANLPAGSLSVIEAVSRHESSLRGVLQRLETLKNVLSEKKHIPSCGFMLSTIHSSKGLEYDTVYLLDIYDGILPENPLDRLEDRSSDAFRDYEEERRLFYVAVTRARDRLGIFSIKFLKSSFTGELMSDRLPPVPEGGRRKKEKTGKKEKNEKGYEQFCEGFKPGTAIMHSKLGKGVVTDLEDRIISIEFEDGGLKKLDMMFLYNNSIISKAEE